MDELRGLHLAKPREAALGGKGLVFTGEERVLGDGVGGYGEWSDAARGAHVAAQPGALGRGLELEVLEPRGGVGFLRGRAAPPLAEQGPPPRRHGTTWARGEPASRVTSIALIKNNHHDPKP